jgi:hypothetical protein
MTGCFVARGIPPGETEKAKPTTPEGLSVSRRDRPWGSRAHEPRRQRPRRFGRRVLNEEQDDVELAARFGRMTHEEEAVSATRRPALGCPSPSIWS